MPKTVQEQLAAARARAAQRDKKFSNKTWFGRECGWSDHSNIDRIELRGGNTELDHVTKWAALTDHEILIVPRGSAESVVARTGEANERELRLTASFLDLLLELRAADQGHVVDFLEKEIARWGDDWLPAKRGITDRTVG
jgi:hypothetical protein